MEEDIYANTYCNNELCGHAEVGTLEADVAAYEANLNELFPEED